MPSIRRPIQLLLAVVAALAISSCKKSVPIPDGDIAGSLTVPSVDDRSFDPASLRGKPSLVVFATPTCPYCAEEVPLAQKVAADQGANVVVVYLAGKKEQCAAVAKQIGYTGPVLIDDGSLKQKLDIKGVPYALVLGGDGRARAAFRGLQSESTLGSALADAK